MNHDVMVHLSQDLSAEERRSLRAYVDDRLGTGVAYRESSKPHLLFFPAKPGLASPRAIVEAVREFGVQARVVDL